MPKEYIYEWNGIVRDDLIKVAGERGEFKFKYLSTGSGEDAVLVFGGVAGRTKFRFFEPSKVTKVEKKKRRAAK